MNRMLNRCCEWQKCDARCQRFRRLPCHSSAFRDTDPTGLRASLAVHVISQTALIGAPFANVCAQVADLWRKPTVASNRLDAKLADVDAFATTIRTVIDHLFADHLVQTTLTINGALMTGINAGRRRIQCRFISRHTTPPFSDESDWESELRPMGLMNTYCILHAFEGICRDGHTRTVDRANTMPEVHQLKNRNAADEILSDQSKGHRATSDKSRQEKGENENARSKRRGNQDC